MLPYNQMQWQQGIPQPDWDDALFSAGGHFLQSSHWAAFNAALGKQVFFAQDNGWQVLAILEPSRLGTRLYCPYGPTATNSKHFSKALAALKQLAQRHAALFVRVEPIVPLTPPQLAHIGLKRALKDIQPPQTWVQDLTKSDDELLADFTATNRNLYRTYRNKGLVIRASENPKDMAIFLAMIHDVAKHTGMQPHPDAYYTAMAKTLLPRKAATLYIISAGKSPVGAAFVFDSPTTRYYAHAGNLISARKLHPGTPLVATMLFDAKKRGQTAFDFVGVAPPDAANHPWAGFTTFKQSFGGTYKPYLGTWELPANILYYAYRGVYRLRKKLL